jgi:hypothetical protein
MRWADKQDIEKSIEKIIGKEKVLHILEETERHSFAPTEDIEQARELLKCLPTDKRRDFIYSLSYTMGIDDWLDAYTFDGIWDWLTVKPEDISEAFERVMK